MNGMLSESDRDFLVTSLRRHFTRRKQSYSGSYKWTLQISVSANVSLRFPFRSYILKTVSIFDFIEWIWWNSRWCHIDYDSFEYENIAVQFIIMPVILFFVLVLAKFVSSFIMFTFRNGTFAFGLHVALQRVYTFITDVKK